jgi:hypothetical protein
MFSAKALTLAARSSLWAASRRATAANKGGARRTMGGDTPAPNSMKARLWEGHPTQPEGWEPYIYFYYTVSAVAIFCIVNFSPDSTIDAWAQQEARARLALKAQGFTEFEFGKHYQDEASDMQSAGWDKFTRRAIKSGEDDDDDEEEDDAGDDADDDDDE